MLRSRIRLQTAKRMFSSMSVSQSQTLPFESFAKGEINDILRDFDLKVGFEIHAQMNSRMKLFSSSLATQLAEANIHANMVDLAFPGTLPVLNEECLNIAILCSLALNGEIAEKMKFDRKHYFYADLPQGYQIT